MSGHWVYLYPEAQGKYNTYSSILKSLNADLKSINNEISSVNIGSSTNYTAAGLTGDYYDIYSNKVNDWITDANSILTKYNNFISDLGTCISNADQKVKHYDNLRKQKEWVEDAK